MICSQEAIPVKVKAVHLINISPIVDRLMMLARPFLKKELYEMVGILFVQHTTRALPIYKYFEYFLKPTYFQIHIQSDMNVFFQAVPKDCIPSDLGGNLPPRDEFQGK